MFLPALPAYLWLWPNVTGTAWQMPAQIAAYVYLLAGTLFIGLRRWNLGQLGLNRQGIGLSLACGAAVIAIMVLGRLTIDLPGEPRPLTFGRLAGNIAFYFGVVGLIEELLFRGLIYYALDEWRGARWAVVGSSLAFGLYLIGWQGPLGALGTGIFGLLFGLIRWRAGGVTGLIFVHGLLDVIATEMNPSLLVQDINHIHVIRPWLIPVGDLLLLGMLVYLWKLRKPPQEQHHELP
jgi:membrane protease YdiL (CAAX protease family)